MTSFQTIVTVAAAACLSFFLLLGLTYILSLLFIETFSRRLTSKDRVNWSLLLVRAMFGVVATTTAIWYIFFDDVLRKDVVNGRNVTSFIVAYMTVGFYTFECITLFSSFVFFRFFDPFFFVHHLLCFVGYCVGVWYAEKAHFFGMAGLLLEMTTPFVCLCWMLLKCETSHLRIWKVNQIVMVHLFHCRTTLELYLFYMYFVQWEKVKEEMPVLLSVMVVVHFAMSLLVLTPYWTYKKMAQLFNPADPRHAARTVANGTSHIHCNGYTRSKKHD